MDAADPRLLAMLVHRGLVSEAAVLSALATGANPIDALIRDGVVTREQLAEWLQTDGGTRPRLSRYELFELLGEGGTARVFRATDRKTGAELALKVLKPEIARDPEAVQRFVRESRLLSEIESPFVVHGHRVAREGDVIFCAMDLVPGRCVQDLLAERGRLDEVTALRIVAQVARALAVLHRRGLVHRDVKPGNVIVDDEGHAVLIDLGFATAAADGRSDDAANERTTGTAAYISPEQARGETGLDVRADIYSLGATLYHLTTGSLPFRGATSEEILARQVLDALSGEAIREIGLSPQVHWLIEKCMAKEREIRFQRPEDLVAEIDALLARRTDAAPDDTDPKRPRRRRRLF